MSEKFGSILTKMAMRPLPLNSRNIPSSSFFSFKSRILLLYSRKTLAYHKPCFARDSDRDRAEGSSFASSTFLPWWRMISQHTFMDLILLLLLSLSLSLSHKYHFSSEQFVLLHIVIIYLSTSCQLVHRQKCSIARNRLFSEVLFSSISCFTVKIEPCAPVLCVFFFFFLFFLFKWKIMAERKSYHSIFYRWTL